MKISASKYSAMPAILVSLAACANKSDEIAASFVSSTPYRA